MEYLSNIQFWHWLIFGVMLISLEIFVPSAIFLWPGIAALFVGIISFFAPDLSWTVFLLIWAILSVAMAFGWQIYKKTFKHEEKPSTMNRRGEQYVGRHFTLMKDIVNGAGELHVDDTRWKISSHHDLPAGMKVKVIAVEGTSLRVEEYIS